MGRRLILRNWSGALDVTVAEHPIASGGFGSVFETEQRDRLAKYIPLDEARPLGDASVFVAHIKALRDRWSRPGAAVLKALPTHWAFEKDGAMIVGVWYLMQRCPGRSLREILGTRTELAMEDRTRVATSILSQLIDLNDAGLVHLDCTLENLIYDESMRRVYLIDLDGCGVIKRNRPNEWQAPPMTRGHVKSMLVPIWYPPPSTTLRPKDGNYIQAERWVVLDTLIRILSGRRCDASSLLGDAFRREANQTHREIDALINNSALENRHHAWINLVQKRRSRLTRVAGRIGREREDLDIRRAPKALHFLLGIAAEAVLDMHRLSTASTRSGRSFYAPWAEIVRGLR